MSTRNNHWSWSGPPPYRNYPSRNNSRRWGHQNRNRYIQRPRPSHGGYISRSYHHEYIPPYSYAEPQINGFTTSFRNRSPHAGSSRPVAEDPSRKPLPEPEENLNKISMAALPFVEVITSLLDVVVKPFNSVNFNFAITKDLIKHFRKNADNPHQVTVRFCKPNSEEVQKDYYPSNLVITVDGKKCILPGCTTVPRGPSAPIDITDKCEFTRLHNVINVKCPEQLNMVVSITRRLTHEDVLQKLLAKGTIPPGDTLTKIREKLTEDTSFAGDITMTSLHFALLCPLSKARMRYPCRASTCDHLQCFDAAWFLMMNEKKPKWLCPVCAGLIQFEDLKIDEHFQKILEETTSTDKILLQADGSWKPFLPQDQSILTLDDTVNSSVPATSFVDVTPSNNENNDEDVSDGHNTTIDLSSEDEASCNDDKENSESRDADSASSADIQNDTEAEVIVLSDTESFTSSALTALHQQQTPCTNESLEQQPTPGSSKARRSSKTRKGCKSKTSTPIVMGRRILERVKETSHNDSTFSIGDDFIPLCTADLSAIE